MANETNTTHWMMGAALLLIGAFVLIALVLVNSQAGNSTASTSVADVNPTVSSVFISATANAKTDAYPGGTINDLVPGGTRTVHINGTVADGNGYQDITNVRGVLFHDDGVRTGTCTADNNNCYVTASCTLTNGSAQNIDYDCSQNVQFFADSTSTGGVDATGTWRVVIVVDDGDAPTGVDSSLTKEMQTLLASNHPGTIPFGARALNAASSTGDNVDISSEQYGNDELKYTVSLANGDADGGLSCTIRGVIPAGNIKYSTTDQAFAGTTDNFVLTTSGVLWNDSLLNYRTNDGSPLTVGSSWNILIPATGIEGTCSENVVLADTAA